MSYRQQAIGGSAQAVFHSLPTDNRLATIILDGAVSAILPTVTWITGEMYSISFVPPATGIYDVVVDNQIVATFEIVSRNVFNFLQNIEDTSIGSWEWDKVAKTMTLLRQDGTELAKFSTDDTPESAYSRRI